MLHSSRLAVPLNDLLRKQKESLLNNWFQRTLNGYAEETASFLKHRQDRFANPVAYALREAMESIYEALVDHRNVESSRLEYAIKIKAVQGHDPSEAVGFIHLLKDVVREKLAHPVAESESTDFESRIDRIAAVAMKMFLANRTKIAELATKSRCRFQPIESR
jgi:hypothetical protein